jgi:hypothetical protein
MYRQAAWPVKTMKKINILLALIAVGSVLASD